MLSHFFQRKPETLILKRLQNFEDLSHKLVGWILSDFVFTHFFGSLFWGIERQRNMEEFKTMSTFSTPTKKGEFLKFDILKEK